MFLRVSRHTCSNLPRGLRRSYSLLGAPIDINPEVQDALQSNSPVVALESTIITHGMPYPTNLETAISVDNKVRSAGSIPAIIGVLNGRITVGLQRTQVEFLADGGVNNPGLVKLSRRDLPAAIGLGRSGGTTIAATSLIASLVGIRVFATGGLGGVHRGGEVTWDVSADLTELGRTPIAVVSAGVKSILDIGRTLEYLETQGVTVVTYGPTSEFPGFYSPTTGFHSPWRINSPEEAAKIISVGQRLGLKSGILFAAPIPEEHAGPAEEIQEAVNLAVRESEANGMNLRGKEATPWILRRIAELTQGKSLPSNIALIENTAYIGGRIAVEYAKLRRAESNPNTPHQLCRPSLMDSLERSEKDSVIASTPPAIIPLATLLIVGAAAVDVISQPAKPLAAQTSLATHSTSSGTVKFSTGGVARNIAEAAHRMMATSPDADAQQVLLVSPIGNDLAGSLITQSACELGMRTDGFLANSDKSERSAVCNMHLDVTGNLITGVADMSIVERLESAPVVGMIEKHQPRLVAFDANLSPDVLVSLVQFCNQRQIRTFFEPTSITKSTKILPALSEAIKQAHFHSSLVTYASPNLLELAHLFHATRSSAYELTGMPHWWSVIDGLGLAEEYHSDLASLSRRSRSTSQDLNDLLKDGVPQMAIGLLPFFQHLFIKCGEKGAFVAMRIAGEAATNSSWFHERTHLGKHQLIAKGAHSVLVLKHYPALPIKREDIINVTGAGDSFVGSLVATMGRDDALDTPHGMDNIVERAQYAALLSLSRPEAVSPLLCNSIARAK